MSDAAQLPVTGVAQAGRDRVRVMTGLTTHAGGPYLCGPALTCACAPEDNLAMHAALYQAQPGAVLVCDGAASRRCALFGELMATDAVNQRLAGLVVAGPIRDIADIDELGFPVWCTGAAPGQAAKATVISVGLPVVVGGVLVASGDQVIADRDGVVVVPAAQWPALQGEVTAIAAKEERTRARLAAGERLADINGLDLSRFQNGL
ncbi:MAG: RraA family protein [Actinobacteria bacterium]|nr:RraA family protein [Actinomycetota bacterium]